MQDKELIQKKNSLMKSILKNPKLARTFKDAIKAPIGSTKRTQAKSVISIMEKLRGIKNDGIGGPGPQTPQGDQGSGPSDYSNLMIFPAAPAFKKAPAMIPSAVKRNTVMNTGKGGPDFSLSLPTGSIFGNNQTSSTPIQTPTPTTPEDSSTPLGILNFRTGDPSTYGGSPTSSNIFPSTGNLSAALGTMSYSTPSTYPSLSSATIPTNQ